MSRQLSRSSALQAAAAAVLVVGVMLLLVVSGHNRDVADDSGDSGDKGSEVTEPQELAGGFVTIPSDEFFATVTAAQKAAGSWRVVSVSEVDGKTSPASTQDIVDADGDAAIRIQIQSSRGPVIGVYVGGQFYVHGLTAAPKPWWKAPTSPTIDDLLAFADPEQFLSAIKDLESFEVVGVEKTDSGSAVHYKIGVDDETVDESGQPSGGQPVQMDLWVDKADRPVQAITTFTVEGHKQTSTLIYSDYGQDLQIAAPPASQVTTKAPPGAGL